MKVNHFTNMFSRCWSLAKVKLGTRTVKLDKLPSYELFGNGRLDWYSIREGKWFSSDQINSSRLGIADTYTKSEDESLLDTDSGSSDSGTGPFDGGASAKMHRLYNPNSYEHFYTANDDEFANLVSLGWQDEQYGWTSPATGDPVYRLYNPNNGGDHHYTMSVSERDRLIAAGWRYEDVGWYSNPNKNVPVYREYNPNELARNHNYTADRVEHDNLISLGWRNEFIAWYGV